ncbi:hypothetical protein [Micromonospora zamorensis]|uniref:hypothetical protein n=1 Tax=Micromonospora zamorensis TaxID=709883 RepID=UPI00081FB29B|nr:hypothetical protein [Micromonospora zamorensis]SCG57055.1 hypothetical protein GA0070619_3564 [Micromonospora zamorensis]
MQTDSATANTAATQEHLYRAAGAAPSIVHTQLWRWDADASGLHLYADREAFGSGTRPTDSRQLHPGAPATT